MEVFVSMYSDKGGRVNNEDSVKIGENIFVLADGLGGHSCGEIASSIVTEYMVKEFTEISNIDNNTMHNIIEKLNKVVYNEKSNNVQYGNMASTVVAAFIKDGYFNYLNVGDSRMYYFRKDRIIVQSRDHSLTQVGVDMGEISPDEMRFHEDRNKLTKVLGLNDNIRITENFEPFKIEREDAFLLCSDGFWEYIREEQMKKMYVCSNNPQKWMNRMLREVSKNISEKNDNLSCICGWIK